MKNMNIAMLKGLSSVFLIATLLIVAIGVVSLVDTVDATIIKNESNITEPNYKISYFNKDNSVKGDVLKDYKIKKYMPKTNLSKQIVSMCKNGSVIVKIGKGKPKLLIVAGIHAVSQELI